MSATEFIASLVHSLAWPAAVLAIVFLLREQLRRLLTDPLTRLKAGPLEVEWHRTAAEVEKAQRKVAGFRSPGTEPVETTPAFSDLDEWADVTPSTVIHDARHRVFEQVAAKLGLQQGVSNRIRLSSLVEMADERGEITPETSRALTGLALLGDLSMQRPEQVSADEAKQYLSMARGVSYALGQARSP